jgi:hypothetical protein
VSPGFDPSRVLTFHVSATFNEWGDMPRLNRRIDATLDALAALPGVEAAATAWSLPGVPEGYQVTFEPVEGRSDPDARVVAESRPVSASYFDTLGIPLAAGELCRDHVPGTATPSELMVNRAFAARYPLLPSALGHALRTGGSASQQTGRIVGIVGDAREIGLHRDPVPTVYWCARALNPMQYFLVRTRGEPSTLAQTIRMALKQLEPLRSVYDMAPLDDRIVGAFAETRLRTALLALFAASALGLASLGVYGTLAYMISIQRYELGVRLALGATRPGVVALILSTSLRVVAASCACGIGLSLLLTRLMASLLFGVSPFDSLALTAATAVVLAVAALASLMPAIRAARLDPAQVLREA